MEFFIVILFIVFCLLLIFKSSVKNNKHVYFNYNNHKQEIIESVTSLKRGTWSERDLVYELLQHNFSAGAIFHDLYLKTRSGNTTQIDLVLATGVGLIVFEVKDYTGWIFGKGNQQKWTQSLFDKYNYEKHTFRFYNPVLQNKRHIEELRKQSSQFAKIPIYSVIVFYGDCELRDISFIPKDTFVTKARRVIEVIQTITSENKPANYTDKHEIVRILKQAVANGNDIMAREQHANDVRDMIGTDRVFD